jgi:nucleoside-diphosphate-sugar epimerase
MVLSPSTLSRGEVVAKRTALVAGASGLAGTYLLTHLIEQGDWDIVAVSRRKPNVPEHYKHISVDLRDRADCEAKLASLKNITHVLYVAIFPQIPDPRELVATNTAMFVNVETCSRPNGTGAATRSRPRTGALPRLLMAPE